LAPAAGADGETPQRASAIRLAWRALTRFYDHQMTQHAAALTFYAMLSLFPALLVAVALLCLFGQ